VIMSSPLAALLSTHVTRRDNGPITVLAKTTSKACQRAPRSFASRKSKQKT
jgi:hypothetical protein